MTARNLWLQRIRSSTSRSDTRWQETSYESYDLPRLRSFACGSYSYHLTAACTVSQSFPICHGVIDYLLQFALRKQVVGCSGIVRLSRRRLRLTVSLPSVLALHSLLASSPAKGTSHDRILDAPARAKSPDLSSCTSMALLRSPCLPATPCWRRLTTMTPRRP